MGQGSVIGRVSGGVKTLILDFFSQQMIMHNWAESASTGSRRSIQLEIALDFIGS